MKMAAMLQRIEELGTPPAAVEVVREYLSRYVTRDIRDTERDRQRDMARQRQRRHRAKLKAEKGLAGANDAASTAPPERDIARDTERDGRIAPCDVSLPISNSEGRDNRGSSSRGVTRARARGTRLSPDVLLSDSDRSFALEHGVADPDALWAEFVDYWIGVPGQRGTKLDWSATWRNRVRAVAARGKPNVRNSQPTDLQAALAETRRFARGGYS